MHFCLTRSKNRFEKDSGKRRKIVADILCKSSILIFYNFENVRINSDKTITAVLLYKGSVCQLSYNDALLASITSEIAVGLKEETGRNVYFDIVEGVCTFWV